MVSNFISKSMSLSIIWSVAQSESIKKSSWFEIKYENTCSSFISVNTSIEQYATEYKLYKNKNSFDNFLPLYAYEKRPVHCLLSQRTNSTLFSFKAKYCEINSSCIFSCNWIAKFPRYSLLFSLPKRYSNKSKFNVSSCRKSSGIKFDTTNKGESKLYEYSFAFLSLTDLKNVLSFKVRLFS